ncbi:MAG: tripartite tricarboxylate transporter TctB family protein [Clostridiaceae bacterium]|nr:tripartite tricarboxylate transporter TctB family protein [Clostridiaceae bacterium]
MKFREILKKNGGIKEFFVPVIFGSWLLYQFINSFSLKQSNFDSLGSNGYARIISGCGLVLIAVYLIERCLTLFRVWQNTDQEQAETVKETRTAKPGAAGNGDFRQRLMIWVRTHYEMSMLIMCVLYVFLIGQIGFVIPSAVYLFTAMMAYSAKENRNLIAIGILTVLFSVGIYFIFRYGFKIILP